MVNHVKHKKTYNAKELKTPRGVLVIEGPISSERLVMLLVAGPVLCVLALLTWLLEDVADWWSDRLVISDKRIYRRYGVITGHSPSISLMGVVYIDASVPPLGRLLHYGTLQLDSAAQEDAPLSRLELVPDVVAVSHEILRLRSAAMPRFPMA